MPNIILADPPESIDSRGTVFLPIAATAPAPPVEPPVDQVATFYRLLVADQRQQRGSLERCADLEAAAAARAYGLSHGDPWSHVDAHGVTPNEYCRAAGCKLPDSYAQKGNNVESLVAGAGDASVMLEALTRSPKHADHIFGRNDFFRQQDKFGIACCERLDSEYRWYWCVLIGVCRE